MSVVWLQPLRGKADQRMRDSKHKLECVGDPEDPCAHKRPRPMRLQRQQDLFWGGGDAVGCVLFLLHMRRSGDLSPAYEACRGRLVSFFRPAPLGDSDSSDSETPSEEQKFEDEVAEYESSMALMERIVPPRYGG